jgi:hypothetical protein
MVSSQRSKRSTKPRRYKVCEKGETLRISVQDVKSVREEKGAMESAVAKAMAEE